MKYTVQSSKYVLKNFIFIFPFALLPAIFLAFSTDEVAITGVMEALIEGRIGDLTFVGVFRAISILSFSNWKAIVFGAVGIIVIIPCVALLMAFLEKHMRIGKRTYHGLIGKLNDNIISTFVGVFLLLGIYEVWTVIIAACVYVSALIPVTAVAYAVGSVVFIFWHVVFMIAVSAIYLWLPCMQITGFRTKEAWAYSYRLMADVKGKIVVIQLLTLLLTESLISLCAVAISNALAFDCIVAVIYGVVIMVFCVRMEIAYFERDHIERADIKKLKYYQR